MLCNVAGATWKYEQGRRLDALQQARAARDASTGTCHGRACCISKKLSLPSAARSMRNTAVALDA
jgi:hypothetical protein